MFKHYYCVLHFNHLVLSCNYYYSYKSSTDKISVRTLLNVSVAIIIILFLALSTSYMCAGALVHGTIQEQGLGEVAIQVMPVSVRARLHAIQYAHAQCEAR